MVCASLAFGESLGREVGQVFGGERSVRGEVFGGEDNYAGGQAVAQSVQAGSLLAGVGTRSGALLSVAAIGFYLDYV